jgi:peptidoglycan/LPS O-acetylase OafA/YrhL
LSFRYFGFLLNSPFWSLSAEVVVNVVYAAVAPLLTRTWLAVALLVSAIGLIVLAFLRSGIDIGYDWADYPWGVLRAAFPFLLGVAIYRSHERFPMGGVLNQLAVPALAAVLIIPVAGGAWFDLGLVIIVFPLLMLLGVGARLPSGLAAVWGGLGELSYPLYAVHYPIVTAFAQFSKAKHLHGSAQLVVALACAAVAIGVATAALLLFDRPVRARLEKRFASKGPVTAGPAASNDGLPV